jgi:hypothetical protein
MYYKTANVDNEYMTILVNDFSSEKAIISSDLSTRNYTSVFPLNQQLFSLNYYINRQADSWDYIRSDQGVDLLAVRINVLINNEIRDTEITSTNPVLLEVMFSD